MALENLMDELEEKMMMAEDAMKTDFQAIRTGKASPALVENIMAEYYGAMTRIKDMAGISTPEPRLLVIVITTSPFARSKPQYNAGDFP